MFSFASCYMWKLAKETFCVFGFAGQIHQNSRIDPLENKC